MKKLYGNSVFFEEPFRGQCEESSGGSYYIERVISTFYYFTSEIFYHKLKFKISVKLILFETSAQFFFIKRLTKDGYL